MMKFANNGDEESFQSTLESSQKQTTISTNTRNSSSCNRPNTYTQGYSYPFRFVLLHFYNMVNRLKQVELSGRKISVDDLPDLEENVRVEYTASKIRSCLESEDLSTLSSTRFMWLVAKTFPKPILIELAYIFFENITKLFSPICMANLITCVKTEDFSNTIYWSIALIITNFLGTTLGQNGWAKAQRISAQLRLGMINMLYDKVSSLSAYSIKRANVGKIINLISSDFNSFEAKGVYIFTMVLAPISLATSCLLLFDRLGVTAFLAIPLLIALIPLQKRVSVRAGDYAKRQTKSNDTKIKLFSEMIDGIRIIKMYGWEAAFMAAVMRFRSEEVRHILINQTITYIEQSVSALGPLFVALICFLVIDITGLFALDIAVIFSTIELVNLISNNIMKNIGFGFSFVQDFKVQFARFIGIIALENVQMLKVENVNPTGKIKQQQTQQEPPRIAGALVQMNDFSAYWHTDDLTQKSPVISNVDFTIQKGEIVSVIGQIGSGKSSLLFAIMKEIPRYTGSCFYATSKLAYVEQEPYILSGTIRDNILFGNSYEETFYNTVVTACCLFDDFAQFENGDRTLVGEKGTTLSGGQKARVSLARAVYANTDLYLLDDPLSAVDSKVAKKIFANVINGVLKSKAVILVTHQLNYAMKCDRILVFENGSIVTQGDPKTIDLQSSSITKFIEATQLQSLISTTDPTKNQDGNSNEEDEEVNATPILLNTNGDGDTEEKAKGKEENQKKKQSENNSNSASSVMHQKAEQEFKVTLQTYINYVKTNPKPLMFSLMLLTFIIQEALFTLFYRSVSLYGVDFDLSLFYLLTFSVLSAHFIFKFLQSSFMSYFVLTTNRNTTRKMLIGIASAKPVVLDEIPAGQLINKFSNDISILDKQLPESCCTTLEGVLHFINLIGSVVFMNYWFIIPGVIEVYFFYKWFMYIKPILMRAKQLDLENKTPVFQFFQSTLNGVIVMNVYGQKQRFSQRMQALMNNSIRTYDIFWFVSRIFSVYMQYMALMTSAVGIMLTLNLAEGDSGKFGQALFYFLLLTNFLHITLRGFINMDTFMTSNERAASVFELPNEQIDLSEFEAIASKNAASAISAANALTKQSDDYNKLVESESHISIEMESSSRQTNKKSNSAANASSPWPSKGQIVFDNVFMRYKAELNPVLKGVDFLVDSLERVAIVGRTGAGKSSIIQALFRMSEIETHGVEQSSSNNQSSSNYSAYGSTTAGATSRILFDEVDTRNVELSKLRRSISIIPQTPFVFSGSIRRNIDPLEEYSDEDIHRVLRETGLMESIARLPEGIRTDMSDSQAVFSVGQRQLVCLARVMLQNNKLIVLDEATANVDMETDEMIQKLVKEKFSNRTIVTVAHRLNTIADYDKVIVLNEGKVLEIGAPFELLAGQPEDDYISNTEGIFAQMVNHTGTNNAQQIFSIAKQAYEKKNKSD